MKYFKLAFAAFIYCSMISMATIASGQSIGGVVNDYTSVSDVDYGAGNKVTVADASPYSVVIKQCSSKCRALISLYCV